jgi:hypothetical protein
MIKYGCEECDFVFHATHSCPIHEDLENVPSSVQNVAIAKFRDYHWYHLRNLSQVSYKEN